MKILALIILMVLLINGISVLAKALPPSYHQFYGVAEGKLLTAKIGDYKFLANITDGKFGYSPLFLIDNLDQEGLNTIDLFNGDRIEFFVDGVKKREYLFEDGGVARLDLTKPWFYIARSNFDGDTTDFGLFANFINASNITIEKTLYGKLLFKSLIAITKNTSIDGAIIIEYSKIYLNETRLPEFDKSATLFLYNLNYTNPLILKDGVVCTDCTIIGYNGGTLEFNVTGFTTYEVIETPVAQSSSGGGAGYFGSPTGCTQEWDCSGWSDCIDGATTRTCSDRNKCGGAQGESVENKGCILTDTQKDGLIFTIILIVIVLYSLKSHKKQKKLRDKEYYNER